MEESINSNQNPNSKDERNYLLELAERLNTLCRDDGHRFFPTASDRDDIRKAKRIVEELSKVNDNEDGGPRILDSLNAVCNSRIIAKSSKR